MRGKRMKVRSVCFSDEEWQGLKEIADRTGITLSELLRRMVDKEIERFQDRELQRDVLINERNHK